MYQVPAYSLGVDGECYCSPQQDKDLEFSGESRVRAGLANANSRSFFLRPNLKLIGAQKGRGEGI